MKVKSKKVLIVGGGLGGMVLALRLLQKKYKVTIVEKSDHVGGLASGFELYGNNLELAYHHIFKTDTSIVALAKELGLEECLTWNKSSMAIFHNGKMQSFGGAADLLKFEGLDIADKLRLGSTALLLQKDNNWEKYHKMLAYKFMQKMCGQKAYSTIWEPLLIGKFHQHYKEVSMAWLWARIHTRGNSKEDGVEKLGYFSGGFVVLINKLEKEIKKLGGVIKLNQNLDKLPRDKYDKIIFTGPNGAFANLIKDEEEVEPKYLYDLKNVPYLGAVCVVFSSRQSLSEYYWHNINEKGAPFLAFIEHTNLIDKKNYEEKYVYYAGVYAPHDSKIFTKSEEEIKKEWLKYVGKIFPKFEKKMVEKSWVFKLKNAQHVVKPGYTPLSYKTPLKDIYLMNFAQVFPEDRGTNFAVAEAEKVAKLI